MPGPVPPQVHRFADDGTFPNSPLPVLVYPAAVPLTGRDPATAFESLFAGHGWGGASQHCSGRAADDGPRRGQARSAGHALGRETLSAARNQNH